MVVSRTPFRVSFLGGGTDFPSFYSKHGGCCIATSIDKYSYIYLRKIDGSFGSIQPQSPLVPESQRR